MTDQIPEEVRRQAARSVSIALARMIPKREFDAAVLVDAALGAALPLIADAIEDPIRHGEAVHYEFCSLAQAGALVRSLLSTDSDQ